MQVGRPTDYTQELADKICAELAEGKSLRSVCEQEEMPDKATVFRWLREKNGFRDHYALATSERTDAQHEDLLALGDEAIGLAQQVSEKAASAVVQAVKIKADNLKWSMSKMKPKKYGEQLDLTTNGKDLPTPLLHVLNNKRNRKNLPDDKKA